MPARFDGPRNFFVRIRVNVLKGQILELAPYFAHAQTVGDGRVDLHCLARNTLAPFRLLDEAQGSHVVQPVRQFDDDDPDIVHHRQQHFSEALSLAFLGRKEIQLAELGDAVHAPRHVFAKILANILDSDAGILHHVVQQAGLNADQVHPHVGQEVGDHQRMNHVGVAGVTCLELVIVQGEAKGLFELGEIVARPCLPHLGTQVREELIYRRLRRRGRRQAPAGVRRDVNAAWFGGHNSIVGVVECRVLGATVT